METLDVQTFGDARHVEASDVQTFGDAHHVLLVVGSTTEGFRLWCRRCDRMGERVHASFIAARGSIAATRTDIAPKCRSKEPT